MDICVLCGSNSNLSTCVNPDLYGAFKLKSVPLIYGCPFLLLMHPLLTIIPTPSPCPMTLGAPIPPIAWMSTSCRSNAVLALYLIWVSRPSSTCRPHFSEKNRIVSTRALCCIWKVACSGVQQNSPIWFVCIWLENNKRKRERDIHLLSPNDPQFFTDEA